MSGEPEGVTLIDAIEAGRIPRPGELNFPQWQAWRRGEGMRPTMRRDGRGIPTADEVALWREVMAHFYGEERLGSLDEDDEEGEAEDSPPPALGRLEDASPPSEGSHGSRTGGSPRVSVAGTVGGFSVASLQGKLEALYDPNAEELGPYLLRMGRVIGALNNLGQTAPDGALEMVTRKAELMIEVYAEFGVLDKPKAVRYLRDKFMAFSVDDALDPHEKENSIVALGELIQQLGGKPSRQDSKLFSTPSDGKNGSQAEARGPSGRGLNVGPIPTAVGSPARSEAGSESKLRAKLAAAEIELEALRQEKVESEAGGSGVGERGLVAAMEEQTKVLKEALAGRGKDSTVTAVKTDLHWPTLGDDRSDFRDVSLFYEEFEDICALANSCRGMNERERLLALRARCRGSRLKTYTNVYRAAWNSGEVLEDPGGVYQRIKSKHLMFSESREEREIRVDSEHVALMKGKLTGGQFEPLFEASVAELEAVGLGKTPRELFLSYLRKVGSVLQKEIRADRRLWGTEDRLRGPQTWEEAHRVVLEYEQRESTNRATANAVYAATSQETEQKRKEPQKQKAKKESKPPATQVAVTAGDPRKEKICWDFRDHGSCRKGHECPFSHDKELRRKELEKKGKGKGSGQESYPAKGSGKGKYDKKPAAKADPKKKGDKGRKSDKPCPYFLKKGACKKGANCDMSHTLVAGTTQSVSQMPSGWSSAPSGSAISNPFGAFMIVTDNPSEKLPESKSSRAVLASVFRASAPEEQKSEYFTELDQLPKDWWKVMPNEAGGYQYKTVVKVLDTCVECMLDGCAGSNHVTEELVVSILNRAAAMGLKPSDAHFPVIQFEKWVYPEYVHGIASGSPVPLKGAVVLRVRLQEGTEASRCKDGPELFVRCKVAARGTSDWHGLILGGRALDCEARRGLGFRPGPNSHILDTLGIQVPRCENLQSERRDRAYAFESVVASTDHGLAEVCEPGDGSRSLLAFAGEDPVQLWPGEGALVPVEMTGAWLPDAGRCEAVLPVSGQVEAVPGIWPTGHREGVVLVTPRHQEVVLEKGTVLAEVRRGVVSVGTCDCGAVDTVLQERKHPEAAASCAECGTDRVSFSRHSCMACGKVGRYAAFPLQGCHSCTQQHNNRRKARGARGYGLLAMIVGLAAMTSCQAFAFTEESKVESQVAWASFPEGVVRAHHEAREDLYEPTLGDFPGDPADLSDRRTTWARFMEGGEEVIEDDWRTGDARVLAGRPWVGETRFYWAQGGLARGSASGSLRCAALSTITNPILHIVETPGGIERMAEETPTDEYYDKLRLSLGERHPRADKLLLDHLVSLEGFLDKSIVFGFSYGVNKAEICRTGGKLLGHIIGREGSSPDPERAKAVMDFAPLREKLHIQQFLGCANWLRTYLPAEFGHCAKILTQFQRPEAVFPQEGLGYGQTEGCKAVRAIKKMLSDAISLAVFDEAAAISGKCPLEQVADASGYAVGGTVLQMTRDHSRFKVLLTHSKSLSAPQQAWAPLIQEAFAQLEVKRASRKAFGSIRTICWTDHANLTRAQHIDVGADLKLVRWVSEILSDGSEIRSLSGRSAKLGDGFSRNPKDRDELQRCRTKDLEGLAGQLRGFDLDEYLGETEGDGIPIPWGVGNDAVPESRGGNPSSGTRADVAKHDPSGGSPVSDSHAGIIEWVMNSSSGIREKIVVLFIADYQKHSENAQCVAKLHAAFSNSMPGWKVTVHTVYGAFEDDHGLWSHVDGATGKLKGERQVKRARVDLLTSCAKVLRAMGSYLPHFAVGIGQGGVIAGMLRYPLLVEVTLQARNLQRKEVHEAVAGWAGLRALWSVNPRLWRSQSGAALLQAACPEVGRDFPVEPVRGFGVVTRVPKEEEIRQIAEVLKVGMVKDVTDVHLTSLAREPKREVWEHDGKCSCVCQMCDLHREGSSG